jgi:hypothetical protein
MFVFDAALALRIFFDFQIFSSLLFGFRKEPSIYFEQDNTVEA